MSLGQYTWWNNPYPPSDAFDSWDGIQCIHCDDVGCPACCPPEPITLYDLKKIDAEIALFEGYQ